MPFDDDPEPFTPFEKAIAVFLLVSMLYFSGHVIAYLIGI